MAQPSIHTENFVNAVNERWKNSDDRRHGNGAYVLSIEPGRTYDRIVVAYNGTSSSCFAFVVRATGELVKPASWKAPQKNPNTGVLAVRYNLSEQSGLLAAANDADAFGGFLYAR